MSRRGMLFEFRVVAELTNQGYYCTISKWSAGLADIVAVKASRCRCGRTVPKVLLIQCKLHRPPTKFEKQQMAELAEKTGATAMWATSRADGCVQTTKILRKHAGSPEKIT